MGAELELDLSYTKKLSTAEALQFSTKPSRRSVGPHVDKLMTADVLHRNAGIQNHRRQIIRMWCKNECWGAFEVFKCLDGTIQGQ